MGMFKYKESSSDDEENGEKDKEKDDGRRRTESERSNAGEQPKKDLEEEIKFGERLQDDLINSFSDKLQAAYPREIEGLFAIQFLLITDMADVRKQLTGRNPAVQVLFDKTREHYILVHYNPRHHFIEIYDSLQTFDTNGKPTIIREICIQISNMFGHLFRRGIPCLIDKEYELQSDNFSCGYRVIGALVDIARDKNPAKFKYSRNAILDFLKLVLNTTKPKWEMFEQAKLGRNKSYSGNQCVKLYIPNLSYSNSTSSSRASSVDSLESFNSQSSTDSQNTSRKNGGRDQLEWKQGPVRMAKLPVFAEPETSVKRDVTSPKPNEDDGTLMGYFRHGYQSVADFFHRKTVGEGDQLVAEKKE